MLHSNNLFRDGYVFYCYPKDFNSSFNFVSQSICISSWPVWLVPHTGAPLQTADLWLSLTLKNEVLKTSLNTVDWGVEGCFQLGGVPVGQVRTGGCPSVRILRSLVLVRFLKEVPPSSRPS